MEPPMQTPNDLSQSRIVLKQDSTLIAVIEMSLSSWLRARGIEAHVIHASSVAVSREHRRAKTDRLDTELLKRAFLGWLRGERDHCKMVAVPTSKDEDAKRPNRERESLAGERN